jgi:AbrB family looped-hinge helix DNA binding protein
MPTATLTSKGQVTIPKEIRERLRLETGDRVHFWVDADGEVHLRAQNRSLLDRVGFMKHLVKRKTPVTVEEMDEAIQRAAVDRLLGKREPGK